MLKSNRRILSRANNERSYEIGGTMRTASRQYRTGGDLVHSLTYGGVVSPLSNPQIPIKNPMHQDLEKSAQARKTYQAAFKRIGCGGILKKKGCGGMLYTKCRGGKMK